MGSYVDQSLTRNESVISRAQTSWIPTIIPVIIGILLLPFYGLGLLIIIPVLLRVWSTELALTNQRVIAKVGLIRRNTVELRIDKVESLGIHQGILGRIFNGVRLENGNFPTLSVLSLTSDFVPLSANP